METIPLQLLSRGEPAPVTIERPRGRSPIVLTCEHGGKAVPERLDLGIGPDDLEKHIGWDLGAAAVARDVSARLDAPLVLQTYSRLVIDCNRAPGSAGSILAESDGIAVPGNRDIGETATRLRVEEVFQPYHDAIAALLDERAVAGHPNIVVPIHSFTPTMNDAVRPWHVGIIYNRDPSFARLLIAAARNGDLCIGENEPYSAADAVDYSFHVHGERRGTPHAMVEVRNDLIGDPAQQAVWGERLSGWLREAVDGLAGTVAAVGGKRGG